MSLIKNPFFWLYSGLYLICLVLLSNVGNYRTEEAVGVMVIFALILPSASYWLSKSATPLADLKESTGHEIAAVIFLLIVIAGYLAVGPTKINALLNVTESSPKLSALLTLVQRLVVFVLLPLILLRERFGLSLQDFGLNWSIRTWFQKKHVRILIILCIGMIALQYFIGQAAAPVRQGEFSFRQLIIGLPLTYAWLLLEVGLVEEFFFRAVVQSRVAACLKSDVSGVVIASFLFGLAHAPGLILRGGGANSPVGSHPSTWFAICFSIVVLSAAGLFLGVVWARTRNLLLVVMIHSAVDLLPKVGEFVRVWGIHQ
ncbi:MAG TPA: CPBP family intramembrane glutamic endopeptidase [candidate division Zixibacteria bacterium]|nr:CPBP family intramembrane glutamic endopeptidase [candidate division Zixibacteria bacterium]